MNLMDVHHEGHEEHPNAEKSQGRFSFVRFVTFVVESGS
jgi:hypothetical protein